MKPLLLLMVILFLAVDARSQVYVGDHKLDTLNRAYIVAEIISDESMMFGKRSVSIDIGKGQNMLELFEYKKGRIEIRSIADLLTLFSENGWIKEDYQLFKTESMAGLRPMVRHIFIFRKRNQ